MWVLVAVIISCLLVVGAAVILLTSADEAEETKNKPLVGFAWFVIGLFVLGAVIVIGYIVWKKWQRP